MFIIASDVALCLEARLPIEDISRTVRPIEKCWREEPPLMDQALQHQHIIRLYLLAQASRLFFLEPFFPLEATRKRFDYIK